MPYHQHDFELAMDAMWELLKLKATPEELEKLKKDHHCIEEIDEYGPNGPIPLTKCDNIAVNVKEGTLTVSGESEYNSVHVFINAKQQIIEICGIGSKGQPRPYKQTLTIKKGISWKILAENLTVKIDY